MDIKQLLTMITLSQTFNYQKAAEQLQYAPSTLFKHIQMLEQEVGAPLFGKTGRQLRLTPQGKAFLVHAKRMVEEYYLALDSVCAEEKLEGTITVGGCEINTAYSLLSLFEGFSRSHAEVRLNMMTSHNAGVPALIRGDMLDVGFFYTTRAGAVSGLRTIPLYREPVYPTVAWDNPMAQKEKLEVSQDLTGMPFVYPHDACCFVGKFCSMMEQMGIHLGKVTFLGGVQLVMERARQEGAMTLVPHRASRQYAEVYGMVRLDMDEEPIWAWENVVYKNYETLKPAARALARYCAIYASDLTKKDTVLRVQAPDC